MNKLPVWTFWQNFNNNIIPPYIDLCIDTMRKFCQNDKFELHIVNYENLEQYLPNIRKDIFKIEYTFDNPPSGVSKEKLKTRKIGIIADYIRLCLLKEYGGIWTDADNIILKELTEISDHLITKDFVASTRFWKHFSISNGFIASVPNGLIIAEWLELVNKKLDDMKEKNNYNIFSYGIFGENMIGKIISNNIDKCYIYMDDKILPIKCKQRGIFFKEKYNYDKLITNKNPICCTIWNAAVPDYVSKLTKKELMNKNILLSEIFRKVLND